MTKQRSKVLLTSAQAKIFATAKGYNSCSEVGGATLRLSPAGLPPSQEQEQGLDNLRL